jgi:serine/threonine protein kinase
MDLKNRRRVAIKLIDLQLVSDPIFLIMIQNEIAILKMIESENVLKLYDDYKINFN